MREKGMIKSLSSSPFEKGRGIKISLLSLLFKEG
jgi:hypothetical protein